MGEGLAEVIDELGLPSFRVPAPQQSAQHRAATEFHSRVIQHTGTDGVRPPEPRRDTRVLTPAELPLPPKSFDDPEYHSVTFAGIDIEQFRWARRRDERVLLGWVAIVVILAGLLAVGSWTLGTNLPNLL